MSGPAVYRFVGGPLDGRMQDARLDAEPYPTIRHVHLHEGPKIVHHYDLQDTAGDVGEYRVRRLSD